MFMVIDMWENIYDGQRVRERIYIYIYIYIYIVLIIINIVLQVF